MSAGDGTGIESLSARKIAQERSPRVQTAMPPPISSQGSRSAPRARRPAAMQTTPAAIWTTSLAYLPSSKPLSGCEGIQPCRAYAATQAESTPMNTFTRRGTDTLHMFVVIGTKPSLLRAGPDHGSFDRLQVFRKRVEDLVAVLG